MPVSVYRRRGPLKNASLEAIRANRTRRRTRDIDQRSLQGLLFNMPYRRVVPMEASEDGRPDSVSG